MFDNRIIDAVLTKYGFERTDLKIYVQGVYIGWFDYWSGMAHFPEKSYLEYQFNQNMLDIQDLMLYFNISLELAVKITYFLDSETIFIQKMNSDFPVNEHILRIEHNGHYYRVFDEPLPNAIEIPSDYLFFILHSVNVVDNEIINNNSTNIKFDRQFFDDCARRVEESNCDTPRSYVRHLRGGRCYA